MKGKNGVAILALAVSGCTGAPVGWGGTYEVAYQSADRVIIEYDPIVESLADIVIVAEKHCDKHGKAAVLDKLERTGLYGAIQTAMFNCVAAP